MAGTITGTSLVNLAGMVTCWICAQHKYDWCWCLEKYEIVPGVGMWTVGGYHLLEYGLIFIYFFFKVEVYYL